MSISVTAAASSIAQPKAAYKVLGALSASHMINDMMQSLILAMYPILKGDFHLSFTQIGLITLTFQLTASLLQPLIGLYTDRRPQPYSLPFGMASTLCGLILLAYASTYGMLLLAAALVGLGSAVFHPESSRIARLASGGQHGFAQSVFQVGGNTGSAIGPLLAAAVIVPFGQSSIAWFGLVVLVAIVLLLQVSRWYSVQHVAVARPQASRSGAAVFAKGRSTCDWRVARADLLEVLLRRRAQHLLHLLFDREVRAVGAERTGASVRLPVCIGRWHARRRSGGRSHRTQAGDLGFDSRRGALCAAAAARRSVLDHDAHDRDRIAVVIRVFSDPGLCAGAHPRQGGNGLGIVLRICVRHGRPGRRIAGRARGSNQH